MVSAVFVSVSFLGAPLPGLNEPHYLTKARAAADPTWCRGDFFLQSANAHYVFFALTGPLTDWMSFSQLAVSGRVVSLMLLACGWTMLGRRLQLSSVAILLSAAAYCGIAMTGNFSGEWIVGGFESKVPAYGCALIAVAKWMDAIRTGHRRAYVCSGILIGCAMAIHPVVGGWFFVSMIAGQCVLHIFPGIRHPGPESAPARNHRDWLSHSLAFVAAAVLPALPGLIAAIDAIVAADLEPSKIDRANYIQVFWRLAHHLDPSTFPARAWVHTAILATVCLLASLAVRAQLRRQRGSANYILTETQNALAPRSNWRLLSLLLGAAAIIAAAGIIIGWHDKPVLKLPDWQWRARLLKFYPFRLFDALLPITTALAIARLGDLLIVNWSGWVRRGVAVTCTAALISAAFINSPGSPSGYSVRSYAAWREACEWVRANTPEDALILGPRESFGLKWFAERAEYVCFKDCPQDAAGILEWNRRLWVVHHWSESSYRDQIFDVADTARLQAQTGVTHILTNRLGPFEQQPVFQNRVWRLYRIETK